MVGLDAAGKTTILYKLKLGEIVTTIPTIGEYHTFVPSEMAGIIRSELIETCLCSQDSMSRPSSIRISVLPCGTSVVKIKFVRCGDTISRTHR